MQNVNQPLSADGQGLLPDPFATTDGIDTPIPTLQSGVLKFSVCAATARPGHIHSGGSSYVQGSGLVTLSWVMRRARALPFAYRSDIIL